MADFTTTEVETGDALSTAVVFATVAEADARISVYGRAADRTAWAAASETDKKSAMQRAVAWMLQELRGRWKGVRVNDTQSLDWPRYDADDEEYAIDFDVVPADVKNASIDMAPRALAGDLTSDQDDAAAIVKERVKADTIESEIEYAGGSAGRIAYTAVLDMLRPYLVNADVAERA